MEDEKKYIVEDEDGVVLYDETDDQEDDEVVETEDTASGPEIYPEYADGIKMRGIIKDKDEFRLKTNEEIFNDEYMREFDRSVRKQKAKDRLVSFGVILFCIAMVIGFIALAYVLEMH